ncbi:MAG TPA: hypothetical protein VFR58_12760 [Flavisolibacter sp.]|nr:hypothetical protein [Flavisolibacter sp.]
MKKILLTLVLFGFAAAQAQDKKRTVADGLTGKLLPYATVKVLNSSLGAIATAQGEFRLAIAENDSVLISCVGYRDSVFAGRFLGDTARLLPYSRIMETVTVRAKKTAGLYLIGQGVAVLNKSIRCNYKPGANNDCVPWGFGGAAEFAELMKLPDPVRTYRLNKVYLPITQSGCWQPVFLQLYERDSVSGGPGRLIFRKHIMPDPGNYKKNKLLVDLVPDQVYFEGASDFFMSMSWDENRPDTFCLTGLILLKSISGVSYSRSLQSPDYKWFSFDPTKPGEKKDEKHLRTIFVAEVEALEN